MLSVLKLEAHRAIQKALIEDFHLSLEETSGLLESQVVYPPEVKLAHVAFPCFSLSKKLRKSPVEIARLLAEAVQKKAEWDWLFQVSPTGAYLNFFADVIHLYTDALTRSRLL